LALCRTARCRAASNRWRSIVSAGRGHSSTALTAPPDGPRRLTRQVVGLVCMSDRNTWCCAPINRASARRLTLAPPDRCEPPLTNGWSSSLPGYELESDQSSGSIRLMGVPTKHNRSRPPYDAFVPRPYWNDSIPSTNYVSGGVLSLSRDPCAGPANSSPPASTARGGQGSTGSRSTCSDGHGSGVG